MMQVFEHPSSSQEMLHAFDRPSYLRAIRRDRDYQSHSLGFLGATTNSIYCARGRFSSPHKYDHQLDDHEKETVVSERVAMATLIVFVY
jgi:hypothetical protein